MSNWQLPATLWSSNSSRPDWGYFGDLLFYLRDCRKHSNVKLVWALPRPTRLNVEPPVKSINQFFSFGVALCGFWALNKRLQSEQMNIWLTLHPSLMKASKRKVRSLDLHRFHLYTIPPCLSLSLSSCPADRWRYLGVAMNNQSNTNLKQKRKTVLKWNPNSPLNRKVAAPCRP